MRTFDILLIETVVNHPACMAGQFRRGKDSAERYFSARDVGNLENHFCFCQGGGWGFLKEDEGLYRCHFCYMPGFRGEFAKDHSQKCLNYMAKEGAKAVYGWIAILNRKACEFVESLGCIAMDQKSGDYWLGDEKTDIRGYQYVF